VAVGLLDGSLLVAGGYDDETERLLAGSPPESQPEPGPEADPEPEPQAASETQPAPSSPSDAPPVGASPTHRDDASGRLAFSSLPRRLKSSRTGVITIRLRCSGSRACRDRVVVKRRGATLLRREVSVAAGSTRTFRLTLPAATGRALRTHAVPLTLELTTAKAKRPVTVRR
jgi:hypothetical protein